MAFRRSRSRFASRKPFRRRSNPYELAQISICRKGLALGLSDCSNPDQFFQCIISYNEWMSPLVTSPSHPGDLYNALSPVSGKAIVVRGIQFDYQYSCTPQIVPEGSSAAGVLSIRSALCVMRAAAQGSGGEFDAVTPLNPPNPMLFVNQTTRGNVQSDAGAATETSRLRFRTLWRGMEMMGTLLSEQLDPIIASELQVPCKQTQSRHVRVRTACRLGPDEGLFLVSEVVNPFLENNPTLALDLFGSLVVKTAWRGPIRYDTQA